MLKSTYGSKKKKKKKRKLLGDIVTGGVGALVGVAFVSQTADVLGRL